MRKTKKAIEAKKLAIDGLCAICEVFANKSWGTLPGEMSVTCISADEDRFKPIFTIHAWPTVSPEDYEISLFVQDRNGNSIITGETAAIYDIKSVHSEDFIQRVIEMANAAFDKYAVYSKENRLDFAFNGYETERREF